MKTQFYVYLHFKPNGDVFYVGKGKGNRAREFSSGRCLHHRNITEKYGKENIEVLKFICASEKDALDMEVRWISVLREAGYGLVNISSGGESPASGMKHSEEFCRKQSIRGTGNKYALGMKHSVETKAKISALHKGKKYPTRSVEHSAKLAVASRITMQKPEHRMRLADLRRGLPGANLGKPMSDAAKAKLSASTRGRIAFNRGIPMTDAQRVKLSKARQPNSVECSTLNVVFDTLLEASEFTGVTTKQISRVCRGMRNLAGGLKFQFINASF